MLLASRIPVLVYMYYTLQIRRYEWCWVWCMFICRIIASQNYACMHTWMPESVQVTWSCHLWLFEQSFHAWLFIFMLHMEMSTETFEYTLWLSRLFTSAICVVYLCFQECRHYLMCMHIHYIHLCMSAFTAYALLTILHVWLFVYTFCVWV